MLDPDPRFQPCESTKSFLKTLDLGSWIRIQDLSYGSKKSFLKILDLGSWVQTQDFKLWIQEKFCENLGSWILDPDPRFQPSTQEKFSENLGSWIWVQDFSPGSKKSFLKTLDLGSGSKISTLGPRKVF